MTVTMDPEKPDPSRISCIGAGHVASSLLPAFKSAGFIVDSVISRTLASANRLATKCGAAFFSKNLSELPETFDILFLCVPDETVEHVAAEVAQFPVNWDRKMVVHTSGVLTSESLAPLMHSGADVLSWHPLQTFPNNTSVSFEGIYVGIEGDDPSFQAGEHWARKLGAMPIRIAKSQKARYHLAATIACNYFVTLQAVSQEILGSIGISNIDSRRMLEPLVRSTLENVFASNPVNALTGPIARGDTRTIARHLEELERHLPMLLPGYRAMALETLRLAESDSNIEPAQIEQIGRVLSAYKE